MFSKQFTYTATTVASERIHHFLASQRFGALGTVNANGNPCVTVVFYSIDDHFNITFTTKSQTKLYKNLLYNKLVMFLVYDVPSQTTVQIAGVAHTITAKDHRSEKPESKGPAFRTPISKLEAGNLVTCRLQPTNIDMKVYAGDEAETLHLFFD